MTPRLPDELLVLSPGTLGEDPQSQRAFLERVRLGVKHGLRSVLLREPSLSDRSCLSLARELVALLEPVEGWTGLHDRVHLARGAGVQGVHLGWRSLGPAEVRSILPAELAVGYSAHRGDRDADREGADYLFLSPVFEVPGKGPGLGVEGLTEEVAAAAQPCWALGGIDTEAVAALRHTGVRGVAVLRSWWQAQDLGAWITAMRSD